MEECKLCPGASNYSPGYRGRNADQRKILFVLHRPSEAVLVSPTLPTTSPWEVALLGSATGRRMGEILKGAGLGLDDVYILNLFRCFLDRTPTNEEYFACGERLREDVAIFQPRKMVAFGGQVYEKLFGIFSYKQPSFLQVVGKTLNYSRLNTEVPTLIVPHPSHPYWKSTRGKHDNYHSALESFLKE